VVTGARVGGRKGRRANAGTAKCAQGGRRGGIGEWGVKETEAGESGVCLEHARDR
jgi:hypothetical protein